MHILAVGGDHAQPQAGDTDVEVAHRRAVDKPQSDAFSGREQTGPVARRGLPVHQVGIGRPRHVGQIGAVHPHLAPGDAVGQSRAEPLGPHVTHEVAHRRPVEVVVVRLLLQFGEDAIGVLVRPIGQHHDVVTVVRERLRLDRVDDERAIHPALFLKPGVAVIPVRPALTHRESVGVRLARADAIETESWYAILVRWQEDAVPVNRRGLVEGVRHPRGHDVALAPAERRRRHGPVDGEREPWRTGEIRQRLADGQIEIRTFERRDRLR